MTVVISCNCMQIPEEMSKNVQVEVLSVS